MVPFESCVAVHEAVTAFAFAVSVGALPAPTVAAPTVLFPLLTRLVKSADVDNGATNIVARSTTADDA